MNGDAGDAELVAGAYRAERDMTCGEGNCFK